MAKACSVVDLPHWYAACDKRMCFFIRLMSDMVSIFLNGETFSPVLLVLFRISDMFTNSWFDPYFRYSAWTPSDLVVLLFLSFFDLFWVSSGVNEGSIFSGVTDICVSSNENRSSKNSVILDIWSSTDVIRLKPSS